ncbi:ras family-domain-containing protein [Protomyces lactucae-debilis]|uniref:GTP-binding protein RHO3 n=1 Tax=Protomyces lactucae-debilis TaxID=2754530 RepID=A0A1Y2ETV6_PROLT|nr:ras family-domain-containing protein [Protomyces lactucae-debilis]ORY74606.1 ras family-domain-containing protein [Protomyces lactucae-debilis]
MNCFSSKQQRRSIYRKIVILGDGAAGKTSLLNVFTRGFFPAVYEPTVFENYIHDIFIDGQQVELSLWDTAGQEEFDRLRSLSYSDTHVIMVCFAVDSPDSLENVQSKWVGEIAEHCEGVKLVLVALKCDLRETEQQVISYEEGLAVAKRIKAVRYLETSARHNRGVNEAFTEAARTALQAKPVGGVSEQEEKLAKQSKERRCVVM